MSSLEPLIEEARRQLRLCNACRYCEGFCAVFPALERRLDFAEDDVRYLASLCHNCGSCYYACQYAPPHEFELNFPRVLAQVRASNYEKFAWPAALAKAFRENGSFVARINLICVLLLLIGMSLVIPSWRMFGAHSDPTGAFYVVLPHGVMAGAFTAVSIFVLLAMIASIAKFGFPFEAQALLDALSMKYLGGGADGCTYPDEKPSTLRRRFHHLTFYGFMLCFAATCVATVYHYGFHWEAPYPFWSVPVVLGTLGGLGLLIGPAGLLYLKAKSDPSLSDPRQKGMDVAFIAALFFTGLTGLALLALRETAAMGVALAVHLGFVLALFLTLPYGKFMHALYRLAALGRFHVERRQPPPQVGAE